MDKDTGNASAPAAALKPNQPVAEALMGLVMQTGVPLQLAACLWWIDSHDSKSMPMTQNQMARRLEAFNVLDHETQKDWAEIAEQVCFAVSMGLSAVLRLQAEQSKLITPPAGLIVPPGLKGN